METQTESRRPRAAAQNDGVNALQQEFENQLSRHRGIAFKVAATYCRHPDDRADLVQDIELQLWRAFPRYDRDRPFSTWMYRVALNVAISSLRKTRPQAELSEPLSGRESAPEANRDERVDFLMDFLARLDPFNRALMLLYLEQHSYQEMGDILGLSETNVASKISRLKKQVKTESTERGL